MIKIKPEHWTQPGAMSYDYCDKSTKPGTLWNVSSVNDGRVNLWTINAWGAVYERAVKLSFFEEHFTEYGEPSLYHIAVVCK